MTRFALDVSEILPGRAVETVLRAQLDAVHLSWPVGSGKLPEQLNGAGIQISVMDLGYGPFVPGGSGARALVGALQAAGRLGCRKLAVTASPALTKEDVERAFDTLCGSLEAVAEQAEQAGITICVGLGTRLGLPVQGILRDCADLARVLARVNRGSVWVDLDAAAILRGGGDPLKAADQFAGRIGHARVGAVAEVPPDLVRPFLAALNAYGYGDVVTVRTAVGEGTQQGSLVEKIKASVQDFGGSTGLDGDRVSRVQAAMKTAALDLLVCVAAENVLALTGYWPMNGSCVAIVPVNGQPQLHVPAGEETWAARSGWSELRVYQSGRTKDPSFEETMRNVLSEYVDRSDRVLQRIGVEGSFRGVAPPHMAHEASGRHAYVRSVLADLYGDSKLMTADGLLTKVKAVKTARELRALRRVGFIADVGLAAFRAGLQPGCRDIDLATDVERAIERFGVGYEGVTRARAYAYVMSGPQTSQTHLDYEFSSPRRMQDGDIVLMELAVVADGYWNDLSRVYVVGEPTDQQRRLFEVAESAFEAGRKAAIPGNMGGDVDAAARAPIAAAGLAEAYPHQTGHGVGMAFHEPYPLLKPGSNDVLEPGMVVAIEPGVYVPGVGGVRNEDDCVVGSANGAMSLQATPHGSRGGRDSGS